ncbi:phosphate ABC transporter permease subunit PstC [Vibrio sp. SS-MA-C1-2]|uniref:phosphate ABC transporter permease subunit PstC n=1 Tax=Vibrio sp. SS-MA-C1-2 TaxID=2908646 RepID=UPI001F1EE6E9|nr:phosphate ABC transporter permease subunit PstC [Vibrio sp. SS-MA-C1-2]UJF17412.1 phosphate ABC transporter permease subunit PstC [Vibrio sp. SS-MA-C1-2]
MSTKQLQQLMGNQGLASAPSSFDSLMNTLFRRCAFAMVFFIFVLISYLFWSIGQEAWPAIERFGFSFITGTEWSGAHETFGILPEIWGTLYSSLLALLIGGGLGVAVAILLTQNFLKPVIGTYLRNLIEILAAIPSVVYGLWGIYVLVPAIRPVSEWLHQYFSWIPMFSTEFHGPSLAPAVLVLSIMILPTVATISIDALRRIPHRTAEAAYGLGATRYEVIRKVMLPTASSGILAALILGFGRALGETMALAMLMGSSNQISLSLFAPANTLASLMASNFPEANELEIQSLMYAGIVLLVITFVVNILGMWVQLLTKRKFEGK